MAYAAQMCVSRFIFRNYRNLQLESQLLITSPAIGEVCAYCGYSFERMVPMKQLELSRYTDWGLHKARASRSLCLPCTTVLRTDEFRRRAVVAGGKSIQFLSPGKEQERGLLVQSIFYHPPEPPFVISVPADYRKHIVLRGEINYNRSEFSVQYGEHPVSIVPALHLPVYETVQYMIQSGASAGQIERGDYGQSGFHSYDSIVEPYRPSPLLSLIIELNRFSKPVLHEE
jgi:hypothetical protein